MPAGHAPRLRAGHVKRLYRLCSNSSPQTTDTVLTHAYTCLKLLRQDSQGIESSVAPRPYSTGGHRAALDVLLFSAVSLSPRCSKPTRDRTSILFQQYLHNLYQLKSCSFHSTLIYVDAWRHAVKPWHLPQKSTRFPVGRCHCHFSA
jgi:hypothetical protein